MRYFIKITWSETEVRYSDCQVYIGKGCFGILFSFRAYTGFGATGLLIILPKLIFHLIFLIMYIVYVLYSRAFDKCYVGL
jgi:hypothetical protein